MPANKPALLRNERMAAIKASFLFPPSPQAISQALRTTYPPLTFNQPFTHPIAPPYRVRYHTNRPTPNHNTNQGGAIYNNDGSLTVENSNFDSNTAVPSSAVSVVILIAALSHIHIR